MASHGGNGAEKLMPKGNNPPSRVGMGKMSKMPPKGMGNTRTGVAHKKSKIPASAGSKLHKKRGK